MSIGSTRRIESAVSSARKADRAARSVANRSQTVEDIDTTNNVLVRDDSDNSENNNQSAYQKKSQQPEFSTSQANVSPSLESLAINGALQQTDDAKQATSPQNQVNIYNNNQSIIKDEEVERTGRTYLKHFYEKNEHLSDIDELI